LEREHARGREGGFGSPCRLLRLELEAVLIRGMVCPETDESSDDLGAEPARWLEARGPGAGGKLASGAAEAERIDQSGVELVDGDRRGRIDR